MTSLTTLDETHDPKLRSWVQSANDHPEFPIQNLPFGIFLTQGGVAQGGVAIGDHIVSLRAVAASGFLQQQAQAACEAAAESTLNHFLSLGSQSRAALRRALSALLSVGSAEHPQWLHASADCELLLPTQIGDYTDFYAGIHHAENVGRLFRPENPLLPNYKWVPIGYHGRSSSIRVSGHPVHRPNGQRKIPAESEPSYGPARNLDFELELGIWVGPGNGLGEPVSIEDAHEHIAGYCLLNDWSARDMQSWEYQPLGPFLAKSFHTTISPWVITPEALAPFRRPQSPRPAGDPQPLPYLLAANDQKTGALALELEVLLLTPRMREQRVPPQRLTRTQADALYWTPSQLLTHHASNGCNLRSGDLLGTGTISSAEPGSVGSLLELTRGGAEPVLLAGGETRTFLQDGDEVFLKAHAQREGFASIGFGECRAAIEVSWER